MEEVEWNAHVKARCVEGVLIARDVERITGHREQLADARRLGPHHWG